MLSAEELNVGETFFLRKNGRGYTVHDKADTRYWDKQCTATYNYIIAVCQGVMYAIDNERKVFIFR